MWDGRQTAPAGSFPPNRFGVHDTAGNVWEWVEDCWGQGTRAAAAAEGAPPVDCTRRILRGGSWDSNPWNIRSFSRGRGAIDYRNNDAGFRVARTLGP